MKISETIATTFAFLPMHIILIICGILLIGSIVALIFLEKKRRKITIAQTKLKQLKTDETSQISENYDITSSKHLAHEEYETYVQITKKQPLVIFLCFVATFLILFSLLMTTSIYDTYTTARKHGYYKGLDANADVIWKHIHRSPEEDTLPDDLHGKLIIYYRFGCPDCSAVYPELSKRLSEIANVYWISSRSPQGKQLLQSYPVDEVPSALYVKSDGTYSTIILYEKADKESYLDKQGLEDFLTMVAYDRTTYIDTNQ